MGVPEWAKVGKQVAAAGLPTLGTALGGPVGGILGGMVARAIGAPEATPKAVAAVLSSDPAAYAKLREIEAQIAADANATDVRMAEIETADRQNARMDRQGNRMRAWLAVILPFCALGFGAAMVWWLFRSDKITEAVTLGGTMLGWLIRDASGAIAFYFGTSVGSSRKQATIDQIAREDR